MDYEAYGVLCESHGQFFSVRARRDVILAAGTIGSPHILMLSGIGPASHLREHKVRCMMCLIQRSNIILRNAKRYEMSQAEKISSL